MQQTWSQPRETLSQEEITNSKNHIYPVLTMSQTLLKTCLTHLSYLILNQTHEVSVIIMLDLQKRKLKLRDGELLTQNHTSNKWQDWD